MKQGNAMSDESREEAHEEDKRKNGLDSTGHAG